MRLAATLASTLTALTISLAAHAAEPLRWQSSGVEQVAHTTGASPRLQPKAPTPIKRRSVAQAIAVAPEPVAAAKADANQPLSGTLAVRQAAVRAAATTPSSGELINPVCYHTGGCGPECGCGMPGPMMEASCGIGEASCGIVACGDPCACGDVGCCGECGIGCGDGVCGCGCGSAVGNCVSRGAIPVVFFIPPIQDLSFFGGVQAFKGALDATRDRGNFGLHAGVNLGGRMSWLPLPGLGYQIGYRAVSSQLQGSDIGATVDPHTQSFFTAGLFHRKRVGLNYGVVYDILQDERIETADFGQLRGQISVKNPRGHELGFLFAKQMNENVLNGVNYQGVDQYLLFYRMCGRQGGEFRLFGGFDDDSMGILGGDVDVPLSDRWSLQTGFSYLIPEEEDGGVGATQEGWNLGMSMVWHYGKRARSRYCDPFRPMFNVADNGTFFVDDRP